MRLRSLALRDFRNIAEARLELRGLRQFLAGPNGQGKTNLLEAAGCLTALRSFRTSDSSAMIRTGALEAGIGAEIEHEHRGATRLTVHIRQTGKEVWSDGERVRRLADHLGLYPVVAFSSQDLQLVRGAPALRRRWLDLTLAAMDAGYLIALQTYTRALAGRNRLLKLGNAPAAELTAFEQVLAPAAAELVERRQRGVGELAEHLRRTYARLAGDAEAAELTYPEEPANSAAEWVARWQAGRAADQKMRTTLQGPHRADLALTVKGAPAREFASEGQQRSLVLALRFAQAAWFEAKSRTRPVILADDVLGELDPRRREAFWATLDPEAQVLATGTALPENATEWQVFKVSAGTFDPA